MRTIKDELDNNVSVCYVKYHDSILNYLKRKIYDEEICKELAQDCFLKIFSKSIILDPECPTTKNYIISIARNIAIDYLRRECTEKAILKEKYYLEFLNHRFNLQVESTIFENEISGIITSSLQKFRGVKLHIVMEILIRGKGITSVSNKSSISRYRVKKYYNEVVDRLREDLAEYH